MDGNRREVIISQSYLACYSEAMAIRICFVNIMTLNESGLPRTNVTEEMIS